MPAKYTTREMNLLKRAIMRKRALKRASPLSIPAPEWHTPAKAPDAEPESSIQQANNQGI